MPASEFECRRRNVDIAATRRQQYVIMRKQPDREVREKKKEREREKKERGRGVYDGIGAC